MGGVINRWFVVCVGDEVKDRFVVSHDKANGRWELRGSMKHDDLGDMRHLVPMR
jgi:hypothetical protein